MEVLSLYNGNKVMRIGQPVPRSNAGPAATIFPQGTSLREMATAYLTLCLTVLELGGRILEVDNS